MRLRITIEDRASLDDLAPAWRMLEARTPAAPVFQGWTWMGCLGRERFPHPLLVRAEAGGQVVGLALFNRRRGGLFLSETGDAALDAPYIEHNAPLIAPDAPPQTLPAMMRAAWRAGGVWHAALSGVPAAVAATAGGWTWRRDQQPAPRVDLAAIRATGGDYLAALSANARQQIRRSLRAAAAHGDLRLDRAGTVPEAQAWLADLIAMHEATWRRRDRPGAFASPFLRRFHRGLVAQGVPRGEVDILRASAGGLVLGYLYNLRRGGWVCAYQAGWAPAGTRRDDRPGILCHVLAIEAALRDGARCYDFLAGEARYKRSLANASVDLVWQRTALPWLGAPA
jgi:CelD/BcsL family acetyltransferase involved in cellulose biosynthesis